MLNRKEIVFVSVFVVLLAILWFLPTGYEQQIYINSSQVKATVVSVNNRGVYTTGLINQGDQRCEIEILNGPHKGEMVEGINLLTGKLEIDKLYEVGDRVWTLIEQDSSGQIIFANLMDYYRLDQQLILVGSFVLLLIMVSGFTGVRTLLSVAFALLSICKILIPSLLNGWNPQFMALIVGNLLTIMTLLLVAGFTKKAYTAMASSMICSILTCLFAVLFGRLFNIDGAVMDWSESLLYAGYQHLDLDGIFQAGIYLACSGAVLDLAIDISSALEEVLKHHPTITRSSLIKSGLSIGKSVVGSQMTTLLLAYMGSYITILMVYLAQGTPLLSILNSQKISAEILHTFIGCIGLVLVSPLTAIICGFAYCRVSRKEQEETLVIELNQ